MFYASWPGSSLRPLAPLAAVELVGVVAGLAAEQLDQVTRVARHHVYDHRRRAALEHAVGAVLVRDAREEARRVDAALGGEPDQAAGALASRGGRRYQHRVVERAHERVEGLHGS